MKCIEKFIEKSRSLLKRNSDVPILTDRFSEEDVHSIIADFYGNSSVAHLKNFGDTIVMKFQTIGKEGSYFLVCKKCPDSESPDGEYKIQIGVANA